MYTLSLALFAAGAIAGNLNQLVPRELQVRQDQSFAPTTSFGQGATCADAFGAGYIDCNGVCYNPGQGETCCAGNGNAYPCPSDSFCLINGLCCPDGLPASTCAAQNGVTLPDNFDAKTATQAGSTTAHTSTISAVQTATGSVTSSAFVPSTTATTVATPYPIPSNATTPSGTASGSGAGAGPTGGVTPFVGGAASVKVACGGVLAGLLGVAALL
ncbi:MAG: hypothetical protein LQ352_003908 [Teloschistes flavicans]|nr:MAG: hypothetical protein LQ352_003908 [Teloschistes flavicans]